MCRVISFVFSVLVIGFGVPMYSAYAKAEKACVDVMNLQIEAAQSGDNSKRNEIAEKNAECQRKAHAAGLIADAVMSLIPNKR